MSIEQNGGGFRSEEEAQAAANFSTESANVVEQPTLEVQQPDSFVEAGHTIPIEGRTEEQLLASYNRLETDLAKRREELDSEIDPQKKVALEQEIDHLDQNSIIARRAYQQRRGMTPDQIAGWEQSNEAWRRRAA